MTLALITVAALTIGILAAWVWKGCPRITVSLIGFRSIGMTMIRIQSRGETILLISKGEQSDGTGWFLNFYLIGFRSIYTGRLNGKLYCRSLVPQSAR